MQWIYEMLLCPFLQLYFLARLLSCTNWGCSQVPNETAVPNSASQTSLLRCPPWLPSQPHSHCIYSSYSYNQHIFLKLAQPFLSSVFSCSYQSWQSFTKNQNSQLISSPGEIALFLQCIIISKFQLKIFFWSGPSLLVLSPASKFSSLMHFGKVHINTIKIQIFLALLLKSVSIKKKKKRGRGKKARVMDAIPGSSR